MIQSKVCLKDNMQSQVECGNVFAKLDSILDATGEYPPRLLQGYQLRFIYGKRHFLVLFIGHAFSTLHTRTLESNFFWLCRMTLGKKSSTLHS